MTPLNCPIIERFADSPTDFDGGLEGGVLDILEVRTYDTIGSGLDPNWDFGELMRECLTGEEYYERA